MIGDYTKLMEQTLTEGAKVKVTFKSPKSKKSMEYLTVTFPDGSFDVKLPYEEKEYGNNSDSYTWTIPVINKKIIEDRPNVEGETYVLDAKVAEQLKKALKK